MQQYAKAAKELLDNVAKLTIRQDAGAGQQPNRPPAAVLLQAPSTTPAHTPTSSRPTVPIEARISRFKQELLASRIDLEELRRLAFQGIPDKDGLRAMTWKLLLGYLPPDPSEWDEVLARKRTEYHLFCEDLIVDPKKADGSSSSSSRQQQQQAGQCEQGGLQAAAAPPPPPPLLPPPPAGGQQQQQQQSDPLQQSAAGSQGGTSNGGCGGTDPLMSDPLSNTAADPLTASNNSSSSNAEGDSSAGGWRPESSTNNNSSSSSSSQHQRSLADTGPLSSQELVPERPEDHPLSLNSTSKWHTFFKDNEIMEQIDRDVMRTHPDMHFFSGDSNEAEQHRREMKRCLFMYAKLNPGLRYIQGMNELLAPLYYMFKTDPDRTSARYAEADAFYCFVDLISEFRDHFCQQLDNSTSGIKATISKLMQLLEAHDPQLAQHLHKHKVDPQFFAFRWITLLLTQEFPFPDAVRIWDTLLSDPGGRGDCLLRVCIAMLTNVREQLLAGDFAVIVKTLQRYPSVDVDHILRAAARLPPCSTVLGAQV